MSQSVNKRISQCRLVSALALALVCLKPDVSAQSIVYTRLSTPTNIPHVFPEDNLGMRLLAEFPESWDMIIDEQTQFTFVSGSGFDVIPSSQNALIAVPVDAFGANFAIPLTNGQAIGPDAAGYTWIASESVGGSTLADSRASDEIGNPYLIGGLFAYVESAYVGLQFQQDGNTYYGWADVGAPYPTFNGGWIYSYAYETSPDIPIKAGQISEPIYFEATFNGGNEVPPNKSPHSGTGTFVLESYVDGYKLSYNLQLDGAFQPTSAGIFGPANPCLTSSHLIASLGCYSISNLPPPPFPPIGPVVFDLQRSKPILFPPSVLVYSGQITLTSNQVAELLIGELYVNFKSAKYRQGELRGEIWPIAPIQFSATLRARGESPRKPGVQCGEATFTLSGATLTGNVALDTNIFWNSMGIYASPIVLPKTLVATLTNVFGVLIPDGGFPGHLDWPGLPGQVLYPEWATLTDKQVSQIKRGEFYINVLTSRFRFGVIGGQILQTE